MTGTCRRLLRAEPFRCSAASTLHQGATEVILNNAAFKARNDGHDNPNIALIQDLKKAGVDLRVCGQAVLGRKIDPATIQPEIELDLWALTTLTNLELRGYVHVGGKLSAEQMARMDSCFRGIDAPSTVASQGPKPAEYLRALACHQV